MRIDPIGNIGIGTPLPVYKLDVLGDINLTGAFRVGADPGTPGRVLTSNGAGAPIWVLPAVGTVTSVTGTAPLLVLNGSIAPAISITQAGTAANGFLSSTDWNTFNNKVNGGGIINHLSKWTPNGNTLGNSLIYDDGNYVSIGTTSPHAKFEVKNGSVVFDGSGSFPAINGSGQRMMWIATKGAFRSGFVDGHQWDIGNVGTYSAAYGNSTIAQAYASFVIGQYNINQSTYNNGAWASSDPVFVIGDGNSIVPHNAVTVLKNGNVGIGTPTPSEKLDISGNIKMNGNGNQIYLAWDHNHGLGFFPAYASRTIDGPVLYGYTGGALGTNQNGTQNIALCWKANGSVFFGKDLTSGLPNVTINTNGNVLIGQDLSSSTYDPSYKLSVNGYIRAKKIRVQMGWGDFVFDKNYKLIPLAEVEQYIKQNGHLPEIPSAEEVETKGGDLGELVKLQMQKIEELTLYVIEQNKKIEELSRQIKSVEK